MGEVGLLLHVWTIDLVDALVKVVRNGCKGGEGREITNVSSLRSFNTLHD